MRRWIENADGNEIEETVLKKAIAAGPGLITLVMSAFGGKADID